MKNLLIFGLVFMFLINGVSATQIIFDTFESGSTSPWYNINPGYSMYIDNTGKLNDTYSIIGQDTCSPLQCTTIRNISAQTDLSDIRTISFSWYWGSIDQYISFSIGKDQASSNPVVYCSNNPPGNLKCNGISVHNISAGTKFTYTFKFNNTAQKVTFYRSGYSRILNYQNNYSITQFWAGESNTGTVIDYYLDNFRVTDIKTRFDNATITARDIFNNNSINSFSVNFNNTNYYTSTGTITLPVLENDANLYNITFFNISNYLNRTYANYNFSASGSLNAELISTTQTDRIRFLDSTTSNAIVNATVVVLYPSGTTITRTTNATGHINFSIIRSGSFEQGTYTFQFTKTGYTTLSFNEVINFSTIPLDETYNISQVSINVNIYDRATGNLLNKSVRLFFLTLFNDTTSTGTYNKSNTSIIAGTYTVQALSTGYGTEQRTFTYTAQDNVTIDFYLLNLSSANAGTLFVNTLSSFYTIIPNSNIILYEYSPTELSYIAVSECLSNINGECVFNIELNTKTYYISATKTIDDKLYFASTSESGEIISTDEEVRQLILYYTERFKTLPLDNLMISISETFTNNISNILVNFKSLDGLSVKVCVNYYSKSSSTLNLLQSDCLNSLSALQNINAFYSLNRSNNYVARVYINNYTLIDEYNYPNFFSSIEENFDNSFIGILILVFWSGSLGLCLYLKNITLFGVLALFLSWVEVFLFPSFSIVSLSVFRTVISIIIIYIARKVQDTE